MKLLDRLDALYIFEEPTAADRAEVKSIQERIVTRCDEWLTSPTANLSVELRMMFHRLRRYATDTLAEMERGYDMLLHYAPQRELIERIPTALDAFYHRDPAK